MADDDVWNIENMFLKLKSVVDFLKIIWTILAVTFLLFQQKRYLLVPVTFHVSTSRQDMEYPTDIVDAFLLSLKESATAHNMTFCVTVCITISS